MSFAAIIQAIGALRKPHKPYVSRNQLKKSPFLDNVTPARLALALKKAVKANKLEQRGDSFKVVKLEKPGGSGMPPHAGSWLDESAEVGMQAGMDGTHHAGMPMVSMSGMGTMGMAGMQGMQGEVDEHGVPHFAQAPAWGNAAPAQPGYGQAAFGYGGGFPAYGGYGGGPGGVPGYGYTAPNAGYGNYYRSPEPKRWGRGAEFEGPAHRPDPATRDEACDVCGNASPGFMNPMIACDACNVHVHAWCYGLKDEDIPDGDWFCARCESTNAGIPVPATCAVCPGTVGAMHYVHDFQHHTRSQFAHVSCVIALKTEGHQCKFVPSGGLDPSRECGSIEVIGLTDMVKSEAVGRCGHCNGNEGVVVPCNFYSALDELQQLDSQRHCSNFMHPRCAKAAGWHYSTDPATGLNILCCRDHSTKRPMAMLTDSRARLIRDYEMKEAKLSSLQNGGEGAARKSTKFIVPSDMLAQRQLFLKDNWHKFQPFLAGAVGDTDSKHALKCLGPFAGPVGDTAQAARLRALALAPPTGQPACVVGGTMRSYQIDGLRWLVKQHSNAVGGILGDEMGLGKTLQVCSFIGYLASVLGEPGPYLVVSPLSVMETWVNEFRRWVPSLRVVRYHGNERERHRLQKQEARSGSFDILVTSYETLVADSAMFQHGRHHFRYVVLDEAQRIKNESTLIGKAVRRVKAFGKLLLTGTPLQNNLRELWALLNFLFPEVLVEASGFEVENDDPQAMRTARELLEPLMLRRTKKSIGLDIPPKTEVKVLVPLSPTQYEWYQKVLDKDAGLLSLLGKASGGNAASFTRLANMLMQLRKVASHPWLLPGAEPKTTGFTDESIVTASGKMVVLDKLLQSIKAQGRKTVIFSQFTSVLDVLHDYLAYRDYGFFRLDGGTSAAKRRYIMAQFLDKADLTHFIFLVSTRAGGLGLNLQSADSVILFDMDWNPQADLQAQDRVHRLGQTRPVTVYRFVSEGTCEERIMKFAEDKLKLSQGVLQDSTRGLLEKDSEKETDTLTGLTDGDIADMVRFGAGARAGSGAAFARMSGMAIEDILSNKTSVAMEWKEDVRDFEGVKLERADAKTISEEWALSIQEGGVKRERKSMTVTMNVDMEGLAPGIAVDKRSIDQDRHNKEILRRQAAAVAERKKKAAIAKLSKRLPYCAICRDFFEATPTEEANRDGNGPAVKKGRADFEDAGENARQRCRNCPAVAHMSCVPPGIDRFVGWACPHHGCTYCGRVASDAGGLLLRCVDCPRAYCDDCCPDGFKAMPKGDPYLNALGWKKPSSVELIQCKICRDKENKVPPENTSGTPAEVSTMFYNRYLNDAFGALKGSVVPWLSHEYIDAGQEADGLSL